MLFAVSTLWSAGAFVGMQPTGSSSRQQQQQRRSAVMASAGFGDKKVRGGLPLAFDGRTPAGETRLIMSGLF